MQFEYLPDEICLEIFSNLSTRDLLSISLCSRKLHRIITAHQSSGQQIWRKNSEQLIGCSVAHTSAVLTRLFAILSDEAAAYKASLRPHSQNSSNPVHPSHAIIRQSGGAANNWLAIYACLHALRRNYRQNRYEICKVHFDRLSVFSSCSYACSFDASTSSDGVVQSAPHISSILVDESERYLYASDSGQPLITYWSIKVNRLIGQLRLAQPALCMSLAADRLMIVGCMLGTVQLHALTYAEPPPHHQLHNQLPICVKIPDFTLISTFLAYSPSENVERILRFSHCFMTISSSTFFKVWSIKDRVLLKSFIEQSNNAELIFAETHENCALFSQWSGSWMSFIELPGTHEWRENMPDGFTRLHGHEKEVSCAKINTFGCVTGSYDGSLIAWNLKELTTKTLIAPPNDNYEIQCVDSNRERIVAGTNHAELLLYSWRAELIGRFGSEHHTGIVRFVRFSALRLISVGDLGRVVLWNPARIRLSHPESAATSHASEHENDNTETSWVSQLYRNSCRAVHFWADELDMVLADYLTLAIISHW